MKDLSYDKKIIHGNLVIANYMDPNIDPGSQYVPIGYTKAHEKPDGSVTLPSRLYRRLDDLANKDLPNYHNSFELLMPVVFKIAKSYSKMEAFSEEEVLCGRIRDSVFIESYDPYPTWANVVTYISSIKEKRPF